MFLSVDYALACDVLPSLARQLKPQVEAICLDLPRPLRTPSSSLSPALSSPSTLPDLAAQMPEMRLPLAIFTNAHRDAPLLAQLEKALRPRTLLHVDAALLRLLREPALGISHAAGDNWLVFAAERAIASAARISRRATSRALRGNLSLVALHKAWTKLRRDNSTLTAHH